MMRGGEGGGWPFHVCFDTQSFYTLASYIITMRIMYYFKHTDVSGRRVWGAVGEGEKPLWSRYETANVSQWPRYFREVKQTRRLVCVYCAAHCLLACRWNVSAVFSLWLPGKGGGGGWGGGARGVSCYFEQFHLCPRRVAVPPPSVLTCGALHLSSPQISACACKRDADLLLTPAISSTLLRNALFFLSFFPSFFLSFLPPPFLKLLALNAQG